MAGKDRLRRFGSKLSPTPMFSGVESDVLRMVVLDEWLQEVLLRVQLAYETLFGVLSV